jgi:hypothetical protein
MHVFSEYSHSLWIENGDPNKLIVSFTLRLCTKLSHPKILYTAIDDFRPDREGRHKSGSQMNIFGRLLSASYVCFR